MDKIIFQKNERAIRHGNHALDRDADYCTACGINIANPLFDHTAILCHSTPSNCPHRRVQYSAGGEAARPTWLIEGKEVTALTHRAALRQKLENLRQAISDLLEDF